jgi:uncharacterized protein (TIGR00299 family) protein
MRVIYFDCAAGAAGDMIMGALVDAGVPLDGLREGLETLPLHGWSLEAREVRRGAFRAMKVDVPIDSVSHHHHHRSLADVLAILRGGRLPAAVLDRAERIFTRLADAEARAHGTTRDTVVFHDVGAVDAIIDITGGVLGLHLAGIESVHVSALPLGSGFVDGPHGRIPVPGPGTAELLRGFPVVDTGVAGELVTPTGAAILTTLATDAGRMPPMTVTAVGYGAGTRDPAEIPNVIRCFVGEVAPTSGLRETVVQIETTIDDMSPQLYEPLIERLFEAGALDVFLAPVIMKRSRPGTVLTILAPPNRVDDLTRLLFEESSTIGVRWSEWSRARLAREVVTLTTSYGALPFKVSRLGDRIVTVTPEFVDVVRIAREKGLAVREVLDQARAEGRRLLGH